MAFSSWFSSRRRYGSRYGRYSRRRYSRRRRTFGNFKAAMQQRDAATVVINKLVQLSLPLSSAGTTDPYTGSDAVNIWDALRQSEFFTNYSTMYDQMHLDGVRAKITGVQQSQNTSSYLTPTVITAWDRNGYDSVPTTPLALQIATYSSAVTKPWSLGNAFQQTRSLYPSIMSEKSQYVSPLSLIAPNSTDASLNIPERNPCNPLRSPSIPFKPQLLVGLTTPSALTTSQNVLFNVELDIQVTFRGLRKGIAT